MVLFDFFFSSDFSMIHKLKDEKLAYGSWTGTMEMISIETERNNDLHQNLTQK